MLAAVLTSPPPLTATAVTLTFLVLLLQSQPASAITKCSGITKESATPEQKSIHSPNFPHGYLNNEICRWEIKVNFPDVEVVRFKLQNTYLRNHPTCGEDYVDVKDGSTSWSRTIRRWCGDRPDEMPVTSTGGSIFVTFRSDGMYTDKGFEMLYWSVPKSIIVTEKVELRLVNFILFGVFGLIVIAITLGLVFIILARFRMEKQYAKVKAEREAQQQQFSVRVDANGAPPGEKEKKQRPRTSEGAKPDLGVTEVKDGSDEKAKKREATNNGSTTRVIKLEPALGSGMLKDTSTTPV